MNQNDFSGFGNTEDENKDRQMSGHPFHSDNAMEGLLSDGNTATMTDYSIGVREELDANVDNSHSGHWTDYASTGNGVNVQSDLFQTTVKESDVAMTPPQMEMMERESVRVDSPTENVSTHTPLGSPPPIADASNIVHTGDDDATNAMQSDPTLHISDDTGNVKTALSGSFASADYHMADQFNPSDNNEGYLKEPIAVASEPVVDMKPSDDGTQEVTMREHRIDHEEPTVTATTMETMKVEAATAPPTATATETEREREAETIATTTQTTTATLTTTATAPEIKKDEAEIKDPVKVQENSGMTEEPQKSAVETGTTKNKGKGKATGTKLEKKPPGNKDDLGDTEEIESDIAVPTKGAHMADCYKAELEHCNRILQSLIANPQAVEYRTPVDWNQPGLETYCSIVKRPMDLGTINEKMKKAEYTNAEMFAKDVRQVWKNSLTFNTPGSPLYCVADNLSKQFEKKFSRVLKFETKVNVDRANQADGSYRERLTQLVELMYALNSVDMGKLINVIEMKCPYVLNDFIDGGDKTNNSEEECLDIEITNIPIETCIELIDFCRACITSYPQNSPTNIHTVGSNIKNVDNTPSMTTPVLQTGQDQPPEQRIKEEVKPEPKMPEQSGNQHENNPIHNVDTIKNEEPTDNPHTLDVEMREANSTNNAAQAGETNHSYDTNQMMVD